MSLSWWVRGLIFFLLVGAAVVVLIPTALPYRQRPEIISRYFDRKMQPSVEINGGFRLEYEVDMELAIALRVGSLAQALHQILKDRHPLLPLKIERQGGTDILISAPRLETELSYRNVMSIAGAWLVEVERDERAGRILLRFNTAKMAEVREAALRKAMYEIEGRMDATRCGGERIGRVGDRIVLEFPGWGSNAATRIKAFMGSQPPLRFFYEDPVPSASRTAAQP